MKSRMMVLLATLLLVAGCEDSKNPLSDPQSAKLETKLLGVWLLHEDDGSVTYYHVGQAGDQFPAGMLRVVTVHSHQNQIDPPEECLAFPTSLGGNTFLNVVLQGDQKQVDAMQAQGWNAKAVDAYTFFKYQLEGDRLTVWPIDGDAKRKAIESGKVKGVIEPDKSPRFTDTTENVARFVADNAQGLFKAQDPGRFERWAVPKKSREQGTGSEK